MASRTLRLGEKARRALAEVEKAVAGKVGGEPVVMTTDRSPVPEGEVYVFVVSAEGALVSRRKLHGPAPSLRELGVRLAGAEAAIDELVAAPGSSAPQLTADEAALLDHGGLPEPEPDAVGELERSRIELELLVRSSLTLAQAAKALGVGTSRLRQRLGARTLYGIKVGREWRIPRFQLVRAGKGVRLVLGIDRVLPKIRPDLHPLAVRSWLTTPNPDLAVGPAETPVSPIAWLAAGLAPAKVAELASEL